MATVLQKLKDEGWFISDDGLKKLNENGLIGDVKELTKRALDYDLRELVTNGGLPNDVVKSSKIELPSSGVVLQVINVRNVSAPKVNQESKTSPRLLQIDLTDGQTLCSGLELDHLSSFSINVAPGTKVLLRNTVKVIQGFLSLTPQNISILGGHVQALYEKWDTNRMLAKYTGIGGPSSKKSQGDTLKGSPPPWISFGNKIKGTNSDDATTFKSLTTTKTKEVSKEESEFLSMRNSAIADAMTKGEIRKQFGGHNRQLMDHNVKKIMDKGYSEEQAKLALKMSRGNLEKAMSNLKKRNTNETTDRRNNRLPDATAPSSRRGGKSFDEPPPAKPSGKVSLFDFLSDKIPDVVDPPQKTNPRLPIQSTLSSSSSSHGNEYGAGKQNSQRNTSKFENNISSSFASRQKKDETQNRSKWNDTDKNASEKNDKQTFQQYLPSQHQHQHQHQHQTSYKSSQANNQTYQNPNHNYQQNNTKNARYNSTQSNNPSLSDAHHHNDMSNKRPPNDRKILQNSNASSNTKPKPNVKSLIDATANLQINNDNKSHKSNQGQAPQSQQQRNANFEEMFPQAKQFPYNPYKIMGFQNKETNEFALNVLKMGDHKTPNSGKNTGGGGGGGGGGSGSGGGGGVGGGGGGGGSGGGGAANVYVNNNMNSQVVPNSQPNMKHAHMANQHISIVPVQQTISAPKPNYQINPNVPPYSLPVMPQSAQTFLWSFKVGDRCLAKYWEDEKYYNAEIQAVTDKTCVVHFPEYGNFEEVLHTDCLPITDVNHQPINQYSTMQAPAPIHQIAYTQLPPNKAGPPPPPHFHQSAFHSQPGPQPSHHSAVLHPPIQAQTQPPQQRYRGNRQVYVPPAQRK